MKDLFICAAVAVGSIAGCLVSPPGMTCGLILVGHFFGLILSAWLFMAKRVGMTFFESLFNQAEFNRRLPRAVFSRDYLFAKRDGLFALDNAEIRFVRVFIVGVLSTLAAMFWVISNAQY